MQALTSSLNAYAVTSPGEITTLLASLVSTPSFSGVEAATATLISEFLQTKGVPVSRKLNNVWARNRYFDDTLPTLLLNSHHDTVKPVETYTRDPFNAEITDGKLYGLGANDAGGSLVCLLAAFLHFCNKPQLNYNLIFCASAEEEISGPNGISAILDDFGKIHAAIVGEPTQMKMAIAEKGLLVLDCVSTGVAGHAARGEGDNAIYKTLKDIEWFRTYSFPKVSDTLGPVKMNVTVINAGSQHNVVPATCNFTVDIRCTDAYTHEELLQIVKKHVNCEVQPRSLRLRPSAIDGSHPLVQTGRELGLDTFGSPTLSDQALMPWPSVKIGPGDSARSHSADEFIYLHELEQGLDLYIKLLSVLL